MKKPKNEIENPIRDGETSADRLQAAMAAERQLMILASPSGKREFLQTGNKAGPLVELIKSGRLQLIRSKSLDGPYYLGLFDYQGNLRILVCRARSIPSAPCPYRLRIGDKEVVSEYIESVKPVYGTAAVVCVCTTQ
jgi:hypothetical protein